MPQIWYGYRCGIRDTAFVRGIHTADLLSQSRSCTEADSKAFFTFLQAANSDGKFNLAYLYGKALEGDNIAAIVALIRAQITAVGDVFFEKLRAVSGSADFAERILPCELKTAGFDQDDLWSLACIAAPYSPYGPYRFDSTA